MKTKTVSNADNQQVLQISTFGQDSDGIMNGIRNFPIHNLVLLHYPEDKNDAEEFSYDVSHTFGIPVSLRIISKPDIIMNGIEQVNEIVATTKLGRVLMNISAGDKMITCAALIGAYINGVVAFGVDKLGKPVIFPILKLSYAETVSDEKIEILKTLYQYGGSIESLDLLAKATKFGKSLLSYHLHGNDESRKRSLMQLGLVDVKRFERGRSKIILSVLGKLIVHSK